MNQKNPYKTISIIIPSYNEEIYINDILQKVINADTLQLKKEIIIIDDNSTDKTVKIAETFIKNSKKTIRLIKKNTNEGKGSAIKLGFIQSQGDIVLVQDADLEYSPDDYPQLIEPFLKYGADVVYGSRFVSSKPRRVLYFWHYLANIFLTFFSNIFTNLNLTDMETGYKVFNGEIIRKIAPKLRSKKFGFEPEVTAAISNINGIKIYEVGITYQGRTYQEGKKISWKDGIRAIGEIIKYNLFTQY